jgi:hypothetical protein
LRYKAIANGAARALIREHEAENLAQFKTKLRALLDDYRDSPGVEGLHHAIVRTAGFDMEGHTTTAADGQRQAREGLMTMLQNRPPR